MTTLLLIVHLLVCFFLIFIVLIQGGKGAELGAAFGGSSQTLFGGRGAATFLNKLTTGVAVVFMLTSLLLAVASVKTDTVVKKPIAQKEQPQRQQAPSQPQELPAPMPVKPEAK
ncbi:MAG: preprotein translocase subunit SecG [Thermodesulfovibrionales bacterium]|nr:preprotein translocase subunit SecG [Thermodesulfovibrionales bacterium]